MKFLGLLGLNLTLIAGHCFAAVNPEMLNIPNLRERVLLLENKVDELEQNIQSKVSDCQIKVRFLGKVENRCPYNSFASGAQLVQGTEGVLLECYKIELDCL